jgi:hypothetical protein
MNVAVGSAARLHGGVGQHAPCVVCLMNVLAIWHKLGSHYLSYCNLKLTTWSLQPQCTTNGQIKNWILNSLHNLFAACQGYRRMSMNSCSSCANGRHTLSTSAPFVGLPSVAVVEQRWPDTPSPFQALFSILFPFKHIVAEQNYQFQNEAPNAQNVWNHSQNWTKVFTLQLVWIGFLRVGLHGSCVRTLWRTFGFCGRAVLFWWVAEQLLRFLRTAL